MLFKYIAYLEHSSCSLEGTLFCNFGKGHYEKSLFEII